MVSGKSLIILGVIVLAIVFVLGEAGIIPDVPGTTQKKQVVCDVEVDNRPLVSPKIRGKNCYVENNCDIFTITKLGIISDDVTLKMMVGGRTVDAESFTIYEGGINKRITLKGCVREESSSGTLRLEDERGTMLDTETFNI